MDSDNGKSGSRDAGRRKAKPICIKTKKACLDLFEKGCGYRRAAKTLGLKTFTVRDWLRRYKRGDKAWAETDGAGHWRRFEARDLVKCLHECEKNDERGGQADAGDGSGGAPGGRPGGGAGQASDDAEHGPAVPPFVPSQGLRELVSRVCRKKKELEAVNALVAEGYTKKEACRAAGIPRCEYYRSLKPSPKAERDLELIALMNRIEGDAHVSQTYGVDRLTAEVNRRLARMSPEESGKILGKSAKVNRKRAHRLMKIAGIHSRLRRRKHPDSYYKRIKEVQRANMAPNILSRDFSSGRPMEKLVTDVTYIPCADSKFLYLSVLKDLFNNEIVSYTMSTENSVPFVLDMLSGLPADAAGKVLVHSDQGCLYWSNEWVALCRELDITRSMSRRGNCWDNAPSESFFSHMKADLGLCKADYRAYLPAERLKALIISYIRWYNETRIQKRLGYRPPLEVRREFEGLHPPLAGRGIVRAAPFIPGCGLPAPSLRAVPSVTAEAPFPVAAPGRGILLNAAGGVLAGGRELTVETAHAPVIIV